MFCAGVFRVILVSKLYPNRISRLKYPHGFIMRNVFASGNVSMSVGQTSINDPLNRIPDSDTESTITNYFRKYILSKNNFKHPVHEITNLNFAIDNKYESPKLLLQLKDNLENERLWQEAVACLIKELSAFDLEDLLKAVALFSSLKRFTHEDKVSQDLVSALDEEVLKRKLQLDELLEILYVLSHTLFMKKQLVYFRFFRRTFRHFEKLHLLQPYQIVHLFYYTNTLSYSTKKSYRFCIVNYLGENFSLFNLDEIGIILFGLIRTKIITCDTKFIENLLNKVLNEIENVNSIHLLYICKVLIIKFLGSCSFERLGSSILNFQEQLIPHVSRFDKSSLISALFSNYPHSLNVAFYEKALEKFTSNLKEMHLRDIYRVSQITTVYKVKAEEFLKLAIEEVESRENLHLCYPFLTIFCNHLIFHRMYSKKLLDVIFEKDYVENLLSRCFYRECKSWSFLNLSLKIEKPEYECIKLDAKAEKKLMKVYSYSISNKEFGVPVFKLRNKMCDLLKTIYGDDAALEKNCLPHFESGIIMRFDRNFKALPIPEEYKALPKGSIKKPLDDQLWICISIWKILPEGLNPIQETYVRHLNAIGYKPLLIRQSEFIRCRSSGEEKSIEFLKSEIQTLLEGSWKEKQAQKEN